jgi:hypothetical protein
MTVSATVFVTDHPDRGYVASNYALEAVRFKFNPSLNEGVTRLKALAALFLSECDTYTVANPAAIREFAVAKTYMQSASMWAVAGVTKEGSKPVAISALDPAADTEGMPAQTGPDEQQEDNPNTGF